MCLECTYISLCPIQKANAPQKIISGYQQLVTTATVMIGQSSGTAQFSAADADAVFDAYRAVCRRPNFQALTNCPILLTLTLFSACPC